VAQWVHPVYLKLEKGAFPLPDVDITPARGHGRSRRASRLGAAALATGLCLSLGFLPGTLSAAPASASALPITAVGSLASASSTSTLSVSPKTTGDLMVLSIALDGSTTGVQFTSVSGGGVAKWSQDTAYTQGGDELAIWWGVVTAAGPSPINLGLNSGTVLWDEVSAQEFSAGAGATWSAGASGESISRNSVVTYPTLTPAAAGELYFGYAFVTGTGSPGSTPGFTYTSTPQSDIVTWDTDLSSTASPTASQTSSESGGVGGLFTATGVAPPSSASSVSAVGMPSTATSTSILSDFPRTIGDLMVLSIALDGSTTGVQFTSVSGGGVTKWNQDTAYTVGGDELALWWGVVTTAGASMITLSLNNGTVLWDELAAQEFTTGAGATWSAGASGESISTNPVVTYPTLTPAITGELYFGYAFVKGIGSVGSTPGFTYSLTPQDDIVTWDTDLSSTASPAASETLSESGGVGGLFTAAAPA
jgi:hypothetical protein